MLTLVWLEWRKVVNYLKYSIRSPKRLIVILLFVAGLMPSLLLSRNASRLSSDAPFNAANIPNIPQSIVDLIWIGAFLLASILLVIWPQSGLNSRFAQLSPSDRDFLLPAPVPGWAILIVRGIRSTAAMIISSVIVLAYFFLAGRFARSFAFLGYQPVNILTIVLFMSLATAMMATGNSKRSNPVAVTIISAIAWIGSFGIIGIAVQWWPGISEAIKNNTNMAYPDIARDNHLYWLLAPGQFVADAVSPLARIDLVAPVISLFAMLLATLALWVFVVLTTKRLWDPDFRVSRFRGAFIALSGRTAETQGDTHSALSALRRLKFGTFPDKPFSAILVREIVLAIRRMGALFLLLFVLTAVSLFSMQYLFAVNISEVRRELQLFVVAMVPYGIALLQLGHSRVTRNRIRTLDQDATLPLGGVDRTAALALGPSVVYLAGILAILLLLLAFTNSFTRPWIPMYITGIVSLLVLGIAVSHLVLMIYPSNEQMDQMMSLYIAFPLGLLVLATVSGITVAAGLLGGWLWHGPLACVSISIIVFYLICYWTSRIELDPTSASED